MAFNNIKRYDLDESDMVGWATSGPTMAFIDEIDIQKEKALKDLIKGGEKGHNKNSSMYNAYCKILTLIDDARNL